MTTHPDTKKFAPAYRERKERVDPDDLTTGFLLHNAVDITYRTKYGSKTVRMIGARKPGKYNDIPEGSLSFFHNGSKYAYNPEKRRLISVNKKQNRTLAEGSDIRKVEKISYPKEAPVVGAVQDGKVATVYYRTPRSDEMQTVAIEVERIIDNGHTITGTAVDDSDRKIEVHPTYERDVTSKRGTREVTIGKVARVEFPRGVQYEVDVEGITKEKAEEKREQIESKVQEIMRYVDDAEVNVSVGEQLEWE